MSGYLNKATLIGNLGQDPELRHTQNGGTIVTLSIATSESWKDPHSGERRDRTEWHRVVIFNEGLGKVVEQNLVKGAKVYVEGKLCTRKWQDQDGRDRYSTEIQLSPYNGVVTFLSPKRDEDRAPRRDPDRAAGRSGPGSRGNDDLDDGVPF